MRLDAAYGRGQEDVTLDRVASVPADPSVVDAEVVARQLGVDPATGLSEVEAARRLAADGPNELRTKDPVPVWRKVLAQFQDPLIYLLLVAVAISLLAWGVEGGTGVPVDASVIAAIVLLNALLGYTQEAKAENAVAALGTMTAASSTVLRGGRLNTVPSTGLVRGDVLALTEGDAVGADARLLDATALRIQEASLTGESQAVTKDPATLAGPSSIGDRTNTVFKGTSVVQGVGRAVVTGVAMTTEIGAIVEMLEATETKPTPLEVEIARISKMLGLLVITIAVVVMVTIVLVSGVTLFTIDLFLPGGLVEGSDSLTVARTAGFTTLVIAQLFNALNARSETTSAFHGLFANWWLWGAIALGVVLQVAVVEIPLLQVAFGTASLDLRHWAVCIGLASVVLWYDELRKLVLRTIRPNRRTAAG